MLLGLAVVVSANGEAAQYASGFFSLGEKVVRSQALKLGFIRPSLDVMANLPKFNVPVVNKSDLPRSIDLRGTGFLPPIYSQGNLGSCTANAGGAAVQYAIAKSGIKDFYPSRLFLYYYERAELGTTGTDSGAMLYNIPDVLKNKGICRESTWPYSDDICEPQARFKMEPSTEAINEALSHKIGMYHGLVNVETKNTDNPLDSLADLKTVLAGGTPVFFGFNWYPSFDKTIVNLDSSGIMPLPLNDGKAITEESDDGHAVLAVGYDDTMSPPSIIIRNSWSHHWGQEGYGFMPQQFLTMQDKSGSACAGFYAIDEITINHKK